MNILDILRASGADPATAGAAITGYGPENTPFPMPPPRPPQDQLTPPSDPMQLGSAAPKGNVLAVIDPILQRRQQEEQGLLQQAGSALTSGGLTADGRGRSKWGAFAHGLSTALNNQGAMRTQSDREAFARTLKLLERQDARERNDIRRMEAESNVAYRNRMAGVAERRQNWYETPDEEGGGSNLQSWRDRMADINEQRAHASRIGLTPAGRNSMSDARWNALQQQYDEWLAHPDRRWNRRAAASAPAPAPAPTPGVPAPAPSSSAPPAPSPGPAPAPAPQYERGARAHNRQTGETLEFDGSRWVPVR